MFLEKLEIQGFKSFAHKNTLVFPGMLDKDRRGITAVVGPNGSGKSNIADAVRWALGEQSMKTLRGKKSEDIIFSGSDKKARLGMAEVSLYLNNEDHQAPIDYSQVILTRRLYRDGESEYLLNQSRTRLIDIQILLAKANFGQKTYSVIGQGMVEGFLNTTLAERKEFFDEATGVKQFQIKRDESLSKLTSSIANLNQAYLLLAEIEPRLKSLTRQVNKLKKRDEILNELKKLQLDYYSKIWHEINDNFTNSNKKFLAMEKIKLEKEKKLELLNRDLTSQEKNNQKAQELSGWQKQLDDQQSQKEIITKQLVKFEAELELKLEAKGQFDLAWFNNKKQEIKADIDKISEEIASLEKNITCDKEKSVELEKEKENLNSQINQLNDNLIKQSTGSFDNQINEQLKKLIQALEQAEAEADIVNIKKILKTIKDQVNNLLKTPKAEEEKQILEKIKSDLENLTKNKEELATKIYENNFRIQARSERVKLLKENQNKLTLELTNIEEKLKQGGQSLNGQDKDKIKREWQKKQAAIDKKIKEIKEKIDEIIKTDEEKTKQMFNLQKNINGLQIEVNNLNNNLNELKINSTRFETKLEDLEIEIRSNYGDLKSIKQYRIEGGLDESAALEKINSLKKQVDQIGGIDPEIEKEYNDTSQRYNYLTGQSSDLKQAVDSLEKIIKELDGIIKEKFDKEFKVISEKFEEYFKILFNGGQAKIVKVLTDELKEAEPETSEIPATENGVLPKEIEEKNKNLINLSKIKLLQKYNATGLAGIEIQACPPGKKIKSIAMLSGGERALTAIALICAIISSNPSPFVVLDEVDASLDEANSERFAKILDDLSHKTQFIVITHNRASMRRANIIYGVTMGSDGISKLLSIKLEEAKKVAE